MNFLEKIEELMDMGLSEEAYAEKYPEDYVESVKI